MKKSSRGKWLIVLGVLLVVIDQVIKFLVKTNMAIGDHFNVLGQWFQIYFIENEGMAFGMKFGGMVGKLALSLFRIVLCGFLVWWISKLVRRGTPGASGSDSTMPPVPQGVLVGLTLITAGAFGNIIDCLFYGLIFSESLPGVVATLGGSYAPFLFGKVVDMFYFPLFTWPQWIPLLGGEIFFSPIFNFADSCVTVGAFYLILFQYKFFMADDKKNDKGKESTDVVAGKKK